MCQRSQEGVTRIVMLVTRRGRGSGVEGLGVQVKRSAALAG
jgi:hypothetical protein